jgi:hypothetical protein
MSPQTGLVFNTNRSRLFFAYFAWGEELTNKTSFQFTGLCRDHEYSRPVCEFLFCGRCDFQMYVLFFRPVYIGQMLRVITVYI